MNASIEDKEPKAPRGRKGSRASIRMSIRLSRPGYVRAAHSGKPEAVVKVSSYGHGHRVKAMLMYLARADRPGQEIEVEDQDGQPLKGKEAIEELYQEWRKDFDYAKSPPAPGEKPQRQKRHGAHVIFSAAVEPTPENNKKALAAAREVMQEHIGSKGHDFLLALHEDSGKTHVHAVIRTNNRQKGGPKLRLNPPELLELRTSFAERLTELKLEHVATLRRDRPKVVDRVRQGMENLKTRQTKFERDMEQASPSRDAFAHRRALARSITRLREEVKKETLPGTEKRHQLLRPLRDLERQLVKQQPAPGELQKQVAATVRKFGKDAFKYQTWVNELTNPGKDTPAMTAKQKETRRQTLEQMAQKTAENITEARREIEAAPLPQYEKDASLRALAFHEKAIKGRSPVELQAHQLVERMADQVEQFGRLVKEGRHPVSGEKAKTFKEKLANRKAQERAGELLEKQVGRASATIEKLEIPVKERKQALARLQQLQRSVGRLRGRGYGVGK